MGKEENIYESVPGVGKKLQDGTWWTNCSCRVGDISVTHHYHRKYENRQHYSKPNRSECVEVGRFGGKPFARWKALGSEWVPAILYSNNSMEYK